MSLSRIVEEYVAIEVLLKDLKFTANHIHLRCRFSWIDFGIKHFGIVTVRILVTTEFDDQFPIHGRSRWRTEGKYPFI